MIETPKHEGTILRLDDEEAHLLRTALKMLEATLGRDEAEELAVVERLIDRLERAI